MAFRPALEPFEGLLIGVPNRKQQKIKSNLSITEILPRPITDRDLDTASMFSHIDCD